MRARSHIKVLCIILKVGAVILENREFLVFTKEVVH